MSRPAAQQAPGVIRVRQSGDRADIEAVAAVLAGIYKVLDRSRPRPNHYDPASGSTSPSAPARPVLPRRLTAPDAARRARH